MKTRKKVKELERRIIVLEHELAKQISIIFSLRNSHNQLKHDHEREHAVYGLVEEQQ